MTNLDSSIDDWAVDMPVLNEVDKGMGNAAGWEEMKVKTHDQGVATHVFAAFEPTLKG